MPYTKGYPDVILGSWRGSSKNNQAIDDQSIYTTIKDEEEKNYLMKITQLGYDLKRAKYHEDEIVGWINPTGEPGYYQGKFKLRYAGSGLAIYNTSKIELITFEKLHHHYENGEISAQYRVCS